MIKTQKAFTGKPCEGFSYGKKEEHAEETKEAMQLPWLQQADRQTLLRGAREADEQGVREVWT